MTPLQKEIIQIKESMNALILAHYYEDTLVQEVADVVGDSLYLAQMGQKSSHPVVLLAGVVFMGESVKILSPNKTVLVPDSEAGCSLVDHSPYGKYLTWRKKHPKALAMTYINSSAQVKSISDVICTSSNAEKIVRTIPEDREILFGPDYNLGHYLSKKLNRKMLLWPGACEVHVLFSEKKLYDLKQQHPDALVLAHPECVETLLEQAHVVGSTSLLLKTVETHSSNTFIVATESGILNNMRTVRPDAQIIQAPMENSCVCNDCPYMKLNTLEKIKSALLEQKPEIKLPTRTLKEAQIPLQRMMDITENKSVLWPTYFSAPTPLDEPIPANI